MKKLFVLAVITAISGCATIEGFGRDLSGASRGVQNMF